MLARYLSYIYMCFTIHAANSITTDFVRNAYTIVLCMLCLCSYIYTPYYTRYPFHKSVVHSRSAKNQKFWMVVEYMPTGKHWLGFAWGIFATRQFHLHTKYGAEWILYFSGALSMGGFQFLSFCQCVPKKIYLTDCIYFGRWKRIEQAEEKPKRKNKIKINTEPNKKDTNIVHTCI